MRAALPYLIQAFFAVVPFAAGVYLMRLDLERLYEITGFRVRKSERSFYRGLLKVTGFLLILISLFTAYLIAKSFGVINF